MLFYKKINEIILMIYKVNREFKKICKVWRKDIIEVFEQNFYNNYGSYFSACDNDTISYYQSVVNEI